MFTLTFDSLCLVDFPPSQDFQGQRLADRINQELLLIGAVSRGTRPLISLIANFRHVSAVDVSDRAFASY